jgi:electron transfer flavoprotein alpha subunit
MSEITIHQDKAGQLEGLEKLCPFQAIRVTDGIIRITEACRLCKLCVKNGPPGVFEFTEKRTASVNREEWKGIAVYVDHAEGEIHPVTYEIIGKAREMAGKIRQPVYCVLIGQQVKERAHDLLHYGVDEVFVYDHAELAHFRIEPYTAAFADFITRCKPAIVLVGGTVVGRSLAPRVVARLRTGLTADCTVLDVQENTDLDQIRPAFGGNIMAHIHTPNHRPQFATVRYKVFPTPEKCAEVKGRITVCALPGDKLASAIKVLQVQKKEKVEAIEDAEVLVVAGRALKKPEDIGMIYQLADLLGAQVAGTRALIEAGWLDARKQIGLSGRTVKPKLLITCGVSGAIQFVAGMNNAECIIAINNDPEANIFNVAHFGLIGDIYEIIPGLIAKMSH